MSRRPEEENFANQEEPNDSTNKPGALDRRRFLLGAAAGAASVAFPRVASAENPFFIMPAEPPAYDDDLAPVRAEVEKRHEEAVRRLQTWIRQPSIAAENRGMNEGCELTMQMLREAGFNQVTKIPTDGQPGIFATLDAGAPRTLGLYFMYDVKQV